MTPPPSVRTLIAIRTHKADATALAAFDRLAEMGWGDVVFACDERAGPVQAGTRRKAGFDLARLDRMGLYAHPKCGWRCGDYNYYMLREDFPDYERYWLIEPDVRIHVSDLAAFFSHYDGMAEDLLAPLFGKRDARWGWTDQIRQDFENPFGCLFPITRISGAAIDYLYQQRRAASAARALSGEQRWPNDESFTATALMAGGFACADLNSPEHTVLTRRSMRVGAMHDAAYLDRAPPDGLIYHPVRTTAPSLRAAEQRLSRVMAASATPTEMRQLVPWMLTTARTCLSNPDYAGSALPLLTLARKPVGLLSPEKAEEIAKRAAAAGALRWNETKFAGANRVATMLHRAHFAPQKGEPVLATVHTAISQRKTGALLTAGPEDFELGPGYPVGRFPRGAALPYAFDFDREELLFTVHVMPEDVLADPFLYMAQRDRAQVVARMKWSAIPKVYGAPDPEWRPVFIFSFGRTGSTLLGKLIGCMTTRSFLEPDTVTQLAISRNRWQALTAETRRQVVWGAVGPLRDVQIEGGEAMRTVVKLRSQANALAADMAEVFPKARYVFMLRERRAWAKSTYRAFRISAEAAVNRLLGGIAALRALRARGVDLDVISYEALVADPAASVCRLMGLRGTDDPDLMDRLTTVMSQDSQASASISREKTAVQAKDEVAWLERFDTLWAAQRPAESLRILGISLD